MLTTLEKEAFQRLRSLVKEHITDKDEFKLSDQCNKILDEYQNVIGEHQALKDEFSAKDLSLAEAENENLELNIKIDELRKDLQNECRDIRLKTVIDSVIENEGIIGVGLITLGENLKKYVFDHPKLKGELAPTNFINFFDKLPRNDTKS